MLALVFPTYLSAELTNFDYEIIKVAFLNGYVLALDTDLTTIKSLKDNRQKMEKYSSIVADNYMKKVYNLNIIAEPDKDKKGDRTKSYWSKSW